jgi:hypothetical protein
MLPGPLIISSVTTVLFFGHKKRITYALPSAIMLLTFSSLSVKEFFKLSLVFQLYIKVSFFLPQASLNF